MHLTLAFLGNVAAETQETLSEKLRNISWKSFFLPLIGLGTFPDQGWPKIVWIGVGTGHPHLFQLHKRVQEALLAAGINPTCARSTLTSPWLAAAMFRHKQSGRS